MSDRPATSTTELTDRATAALLAHGVGDCLGATTEFCTPTQIRDRYGTVTDIIGGGAFNWRPGQGTDDTDLSVILCDTYAANGHLDLADFGDRLLNWYDRGPVDIGCTTSTALRALRSSGNPTTSGEAAADSAGNGSLMRTLAPAIVHHDNTTARRRDAVAASAVTHAHPDCIDACVAYCDLVAQLLHDTPPLAAIDHVIADGNWTPNVADAVRTGRQGLAPDSPTSGWVISSLTIAVAALVTAETIGLEAALVDVINRGNDADTNGAIAGGLLGARHGLAAIPQRWTGRLEQGQRMRQHAIDLTLATERTAAAN